MEQLGARYVERLWWAWPITEADVIEPGILEAKRQAAVEELHGMAVRAQRVTLGHVTFRLAGGAVFDDHGTDLALVGEVVVAVLP